MRILISQAESKSPPFFFIHDSLERSWYHFFAGHTLIPAPNIPSFDFGNIEWDCLVFTGGNDSVSRHLTENRLYQMAEINNRPIIGFCHGAFAVNDLAGGINGPIDGHVGQEHLVEMAGKTHCVNSYHSQNIAVLAPGFQSLAQDPHGNVEAFRHVFKPIWGVVWHPERMDQPLLPEDLATYLRTSSSFF